MSDDIDDVYRRAADQDPSRPSDAVRRAVIDRAASLAAGRIRQPRPHRWRRALGGLAAAALAGLLVVPRFFQPSPSHAPASRVPANAPAAPEMAAAPHRSDAAKGPSPAASLERAETADAAMAPDARLSGSAAAPARVAEAGHRQAQKSSRMAQSDVNRRDARGRTALMMAVARADLALVQDLLAQGADPNLADPNGRTPLRAALDAHQPAIAEALRRAGAQ